MTCALQSNEQKRKAAESIEYVKYAIQTHKYSTQKQKQSQSVNGGGTHGLVE
jgi:hypothetical protein